MMVNTTQVEQHGLKINIHLAQHFQDLGIVTAMMSKDEYHIRELAEMITPEVICDFGGHIGTFGMMALQLWPKARLIAVEPDPDNCALYRQNLRDNGMVGIVLEAAISYNPDCKWLVHGTRTTGGGFMRTFEQAQRDCFDGRRRSEGMTEVKLMTVEEVLSSVSCKETIDLCKWDCEGGEIEAFEKMDPATFARFRFMVGEHHIGKKHSTPRHLRGPYFERTLFWRRVRRKFPHLKFDYEEKDLGLFNAWPKDFVPKEIA